MLYSPVGRDLGESSLVKLIGGAATYMGIWEAGYLRIKEWGFWVDV